MAWCAGGVTAGVTAGVTTGVATGETTGPRENHISSSSSSSLTSTGTTDTSTTPPIVIGNVRSLQTENMSRVHLSIPPHLNPHDNGVPYPIQVHPIPVPHQCAPIDCTTGSGSPVFNGITHPINSLPFDHQGTMPMPMSLAMSTTVQSVGAQLIKDVINQIQNDPASPKHQQQPQQQQQQPPPQQPQQQQQQQQQQHQQQQQQPQQDHTPSHQPSNADISKPSTSSTKPKKSPSKKHKSSDDNNQDGEGKKTKKKRKRDPDSWKRNILKKKCNLGEEHVNAHGKVIPAKKMREGCDDKCRLKCHGKVIEEVRQKIFQAFWRLGDRDARRNFVLRHISVTAPVRVKANPRKLNTIRYFLPMDQKKAVVQVCKKFFTATIGVTDKVITTAVNKSTLQW